MGKYKRVKEMTLEEKRAKVSKFNVIDDVFFQKMMEDREVCEEILRIILADSELNVIECIPQASIKNVIGKSVVLDVLCCDKNGKYYNVEVQKANDDDHQKRVRYNGAVTTTYAMKAGDDYREMPDVKVVFISKFDVFDDGKTMYHIDRIVRETGKVVENGMEEIYVNTKIDDGTKVAELMSYFKKSQGETGICPKLSKRVMEFKTEQKEVTAMCELMELERQEGREEAQANSILKYMDKSGASFEEACDFFDIPDKEYDLYRDKIEGLREQNPIEQVYRGKQR